MINKHNYQKNLLHKNAVIFHSKRRLLNLETNLHFFKNRNCFENFKSHMNVFDI